MESLPQRQQVVHGGKNLGAEAAGDVRVEVVFAGPGQALGILLTGDLGDVQAQLAEVEGLHDGDGSEDGVFVDLLIDLLSFAFSLLLSFFYQV